MTVPEQTRRTHNVKVPVHEYEGLTWGPGDLASEALRAHALGATTVLVAVGGRVPDALKDGAQRANDLLAGTLRIGEPHWPFPGRVAVDLTAPSNDTVALLAAELLPEPGACTEMTIARILAAAQRLTQ